MTHAVLQMKLILRTIIDRTKLAGGVVVERKRPADQSTNPSTNCNALKASGVPTPGEQPGAVHPDTHHHHADSTELYHSRQWILSLALVLQPLPSLCIHEVTVVKMKLLLSALPPLIFCCCSCSSAVRCGYCSSFFLLLL